MEQKKISEMTEQELDEALESGNIFYEKVKEDLENHKELNLVNDDNEDEQKPLLSQLYDKIFSLCDQKNDLIKKIIGQMYKGTLINGKLSIRKDGDIYYYKRHYANISMRNIKKLIVENLHEVSEKIGDNNIDILEFLLPLVYDVNSSDDSLIDEDEDEKFKLKLPKTYRFVNIYKNRLDIDEVNMIIISNKGEINFKIENIGRDGEVEEERLTLTSVQENILLRKFNKDIEEMTKHYINKKKNTIKILESEIEQIKEKGSSLLIVAQLKQENKDGVGI